MTHVILVAARILAPLSVWPHDNGLIALGLARYGFKEAAARVFGALFDAATYMDLRRLPELYCGFARRKHTAPTQYPVACSPQAWASAAVFALLQATPGLQISAFDSEISFYRTRLPEFLDRRHLRQLRVNQGSADVLLQRNGTDVTATQTRRRGEATVVVRY